MWVPDAAAAGGVLWLPPRVLAAFRRHLLLKLLTLRTKPLPPFLLDRLLRDVPKLRCPLLATEVILLWMYVAMIIILLVVDID